MNSYLQRVFKISAEVVYLQRWHERQTDRQTETESQTERKTDRDRQTETETELRVRCSTSVCYRPIVLNVLRRFGFAHLFGIYFSPGLVSH